MLFDNPIADAQTQTGSNADRFRSEKRIEYILHYFRWNSLAGILELYVNPITFEVRSDPNFPFPGDCLSSINQYIHENLIELARITLYERKIGIIFDHFDSILEFMVYQRKRRLNSLVL